MPVTLPVRVWSGCLIYSRHWPVWRVGASCYKVGHRYRMISVKRCLTFWRILVVAWDRGSRPWWNIILIQRRRDLKRNMHIYFGSAFHFPPRLSDIFHNMFPNMRLNIFTLLSSSRLYYKNKFRCRLFTVLAKIKSATFCVRNEIFWEPKCRP